MQWEISKKTLHAQMNNKGSHIRARERKQKEGVRISQQLRFSNNREECKSKAFTASLVPVFNPLLTHFYSALHRGIVCLLEHQLLRRLVPGKVKKNTYSDSDTRHQIVFCAQTTCFKRYKPFTIQHSVSSQNYKQNQKLLCNKKKCFQM